MCIPVRYVYSRGKRKKKIKYSIFSCNPNISYMQILKFFTETFFGLIYFQILDSFFFFFIHKDLLAGLRLSLALPHDETSLFYLLYFI